MRLPNDGNRYRVRNGFIERIGLIGKKTKISIPAVCIAAMVVIGCASAPSGPQRSMKGPEDSGAFTLFVKDNELGSVEFRLEPNGTYSRTSVISLGGQKRTERFRIECDANGSWTNVSVETPVQTVRVSRDGSSGTVVVDGKTYRFTMGLECLVTDASGPALESRFLRAYDIGKGGMQRFPCLLAGGDSVRISELVVSSAERRVRRISGVETSFTVFHATLGSVPYEYWAGDDCRVFMASIPSQYAVFVRQGFEELAGDVVRREVSRRTIMMPMRDGTCLATDIYASESDLPLPVILIRTPYGKEGERLDAVSYAKAGYAVAVQDCRGCFDSEGAWEPFRNEAADGYDAVERLAAEPWSNGKIGMIGTSYVGWVQLWAAAERPPHLVTIIPNCAPPDPFYNMPYEYGAFFLWGASWWTNAVESKAAADITGKAMAAVNSADYFRILSRLPVVDIDKDLFGREVPYWRDWIGHDTNDDWWAPANFLSKLKDVDIPVFLQSGWFDGDGIGTKLSALELEKSPRARLKLIVGPWGHTDQSSAGTGTVNFGAEALLDLRSLYRRWFDYWLKDIRNGITDEPAVKLFVMDSNLWLEGPRYPLPQTVFTPYYLSSVEGANTSRGDGRLSPSISSTGLPSDSYRYDPGTPTPSPDMWDGYDAQEPKLEDAAQESERLRTFRERVTAKRQDILVFQTEQLAQPVTVCGPVEAVLYAATDAPDTDWFVSLMDVDERGTILPLTRGVVRARFRESLSEPSLLEPGKTYRYTVDMWHTGITFAKGHRIRVEVASAMFPLFSRNLNTGGRNERETEYRTAAQTVFHSAEFPSHIVLPVIPREDLR